jgi:hypothetical protein
VGDEEAVRPAGHGVDAEALAAEREASAGRLPRGAPVVRAMDASGGGAGDERRFLRREPGRLGPFRETASRPPSPRIGAQDARCRADEEEV